MQQRDLKGNACKLASCPPLRQRPLIRLNQFPSLEVAVVHIFIVLNVLKLTQQLEINFVQNGNHLLLEEDCDSATHPCADRYSKVDGVEKFWVSTPMISPLISTVQPDHAQK